MNHTDLHARDLLLLRPSEMAKRLYAFDWTKTPLGAMETWPLTLLIAVGICLNSRFPMTIWWGPGLTYIYNDAYAALLGKRHPDAFGRSGRDVWAEIWPAIAPQVEAVLHGGEATWNERVHLVVERNDFPEDAWFTWSYSPLPDGKGGIGGLFNACMEDTGRVLAERERDQLAEHRQLALDAAKMGWWHLHPADNLVTWDRRFKMIFGVTDDQLPYDKIILSVHPDDREMVKQAVQQALEASQPQSFTLEYRIIRGDGVERWILANGIASLKGVGDLRRATGLAGTVSDITNRKRDEAALRDQEERLRLAVAIAGLGTFDIDLVTDIVTVNDTGRAIYGWAEDELLTFSKVQTYFYPDDRAEVMKRVEAARDPEGTGEFEVEQRIIRTDGILRWIRVRGRTQFTPGGRALRCVGTYIDITEHKFLEQERESLLESERAARNEAERIGRMKDEFLATLSHELRTPLNAIMGWSQILQMKPPDPERLQSGLKSIESNSRLQAQLIEDLLDMSRIISGKVRLDMRIVPVQEMVEQAVEAVRPAAEAKGVRLAKELSARPCVVWGDPNRLHQVLWNLLSNAVKFTPAQGRVKVVLECDRQNISIGISDTGQGINPEFLPHVFERFRQADASITRSHGGLGLGLAIVKQLTELHGGHVRASSEGEGQGAVFTVTLPQAAPHFSDAEAERGGEDSIKPQLSGAKILVVDDQADARLVLRQLFEPTRANIVLASSGEQALDLVGQQRPDLLVCDIGMPGMDGYELIRKIRALPPVEGGETPAIALTAFARSEDRERALAAGYQEHLPKPVEQARLFSACADLLPH